VSEPRRYFLKISQTFNGVRPDVYEHPEGMFVDYDDYALLKADVERLKKTGDAMDALIMSEIYARKFCFVPGDVKEWRAAKEGKQS